MSDTIREAEELRQRCIEWRSAQEANDRDDALIVVGVGQVESALDRAEAAEAERDKYRDARRDAERAARMGLSRLTLARASMKAAVKHDDLAQLEAWLLAAGENDWFGEIKAALRDDTAAVPSGDAEAEG